ncbi:MAG: hypothetical protein TYPL_5250 [Candidatus Tyloplasma litorale]|nr:MAG: hypothetical protein TYPL_5250 [Mycoplasmatales bacterium]
MFITLLVVFFIIFALLSIVINGIQTGSSNGFADWTEILFGSDFDMQGSLAMGIIIINTIWMAFLVILIAAPISIGTALFITRVLPKNLSSVMIALTSILAAIPSVVYGAFGKYFLLNFVNDIGLSQSATDATLLSVVIIVSLMVMPTITLMTTTSIMMVDKRIEDSSEALGATKMQTSILVTLRAAKTGIIIGVLFAIGRCLGEATAISMLSGNRSVTSGATFSLFQVSLFMSPVIMYAFGQATTSAGAMVTYEVMSALLILITFILFLAIKYLEYITNDSTKSQKQSKKISAQKEIENKLNHHDEQELTNSQLNLYSRNLIDSFYKNRRYTSDEFTQRSEISIISQEASIEKTKDQVNYKKRKSFKYKAIISIASLIGVVALISIVGFLFNTDLSLFTNWDYISHKGTAIVDINGQEIRYLGLAIAMFGTFITVIMAMLIAMPLGIAIATYSHTYLNGESLLSKIVSFAFQIMTSIPAVIYATLATIVFTSTGWFSQNFYSFEPILMLSLVILPTIIKQTMEGYRNVNAAQVEGSLALGSTQIHTSRRIIIVQSMPAILSAAILAISIVIADSAIMITILGKPDEWTSPENWMIHGGYTLTTTIYWLSSTLANEVGIQSSIAIEQIKVIGIILMILVFWLTLISQKLKFKDYIGSSIMFVGITCVMISPFIVNGGVLWMYILGYVLGVIGFIYKPIMNLVIRK